MKRNITITIARQYGSGGRTVGKLLADRLGIPFYNKDLTRMAAEESGISEELFLKADENVSGKNPISLKISKSIYKGGLLSPKDDKFTSRENLFNYQAAVIQKLAENESSIIIGRAANYVLKDYDNVVRVFVHAPMDFLMENAAKNQPLHGKELEQYIRKTDQQKADYYRYYTGGSWDSALNYDLCLDSKVLGYDKCVEEIIAYTKVRFGEDIFD